MPNGWTWASVRPAETTPTHAREGARSGIIDLEVSVRLYRDSVRLFIIWCYRTTAWGDLDGRLSVLQKRFS